MAAHPTICETLAAGTLAFYRHALATLQAAHIPFLVGGTYALEYYTGIVRHTKDFDIFVRPRDYDRVGQVFTSAGYQTDLTFPHWLGKVIYGDEHIDIIFSSGNGICGIDDEWFTHAVEANIVGLSLRLCPPEEMIWSKAFVSERERYDGADVAHMLRARGTTLMWSRLLQRFDTHWRVLLSHLVLFGFIYPAERSQIPEWVMQGLLYRLQHELQETSPEDPLCQGTLLSREQYLTDVARWGYQDARLLPQGPMTQEEIAHWTAAIERK